MSAHVGGQMLTLEGKIRSLGRAFTKYPLNLAKNQFKEVDG